jgi:hypothetical protein
MSEPAYFPGLTEDDARRPSNVARIVNNMLMGSLNVTLDVSLDAATSPITIQDPRIHPSSYIGIMPMGSGTPPAFHITAIGDQQFTIAWTGGTGIWNVRFLIIG